MKTIRPMSPATRDFLDFLDKMDQAFVDFRADLNNCSWWINCERWLSVTGGTVKKNDAGEPYGEIFAYRPSVDKTDDKGQVSAARLVFPGLPSEEGAVVLWDSPSKIEHDKMVYTLYVNPRLPFARI